MEQPKFIITIERLRVGEQGSGIGYFRLGMVNQHKDLLIGDDQCIGGGYYQFDWTSNRLILDRASYDFGRPCWHLLDTLKVPAQYRGLRIVYTYDDNSHEDLTSSSLGGASAISSELDGARLVQAFNVSDELQIVYY